jgi:hypothetical protein
MGIFSNMYLFVFRFILPPETFTIEAEKAVKHYRFNYYPIIQLHYGYNITTGEQVWDYHQCYLEQCHLGYFNEIKNRVK